MNIDYPLTLYLENWVIHISCEFPVAIETQFSVHFYLAISINRKSEG